MATVASVTLIDREGASTAGSRTATDTYRVLFSLAGSMPNMNDARLAIDPATGLFIPRRGDPYDATDPGMRCRDADPRLERAPSWQSWIVKVGFTTGEVGNENENPTLDPPAVTWGDQESSEPVYRDRLGDPITNSAKETFDPPIEMDVYDDIVTVVRNVSFFDAGVARTYRGKINSAGFFIKGAAGPVLPYVAKLKSYVAVSQVRNGFAFWQETIQIMFRGDGWKRKILDQGYRELDANGRPQLITDDQGMPFNQPSLLNGIGKRLEPGGTAVFLEKELNGFANFNDLNLPVA